MANPVWVVVLSGPASNRAKAEVALEQAGIPLLPADHYAQMDWERKLTPLASGEKPKTAQAFITVAHPDINAPVAAVEKHGYVLRVHHEMAPEPQPSVEQVLTATLAEMRAEIDALKAVR